MKKTKEKKSAYFNSSQYIEFDKPNEEQKYPHFRKYKKSGHPAMITGEHSAKEWNYRKVMHKDRDGRHLNDKYDPNPNPLDSEPMYVARRVRYDDKKNFSTWRYRWRIKNKKSSSPRDD